MISLTINNKKYEYDEGISVSDLLSEHCRDKNPILVKIDNEIHSLRHKLYSDCTIDFIDATTELGHKAYEKTALMIFITAVHDLYPELPLNNIAVKFIIGNGLYITIDGIEISDSFLSGVKKHMQEIASAKLPISQHMLRSDEAIRIFDRLGMSDKSDMLKYRRKSLINIHETGDICDYYYDHLGLNTGCLKNFGLKKYYGGLVLVTPIDPDDQAEKFVFSKKLFDVLHSYSEIMTNAGFTSISEFNNSIATHGFTYPVLIQEAMMEKEISKIAVKIAANKNIKMILIAGPSSSGKTTFSHRLSSQLFANGLNGITLETDNYFIDRDKVPCDADGKPDFEALEAMDIKQFEKDCLEMISGKEVQIPYYNFKTGKREYTGKKLKLEDNEILIAEGIHCLDPAMNGNLPKDRIFKIFIAPLTQLSIDNHNYVSANDTRLIRRIIRDYRKRNYSPSATILQWESVRRGEDKYILPFRDDADVIFNSSIIYELGILKPYAEGLLFNIKKKDPAYIYAKHLLKILDFFLCIPETLLPSNSLLTEFVGGNIFGV